MKPLDRFIQKLRINEAAKYKPANSRLLDIVCADGAIFLQTFNKIREGIGIDTGIQTGSKGNNFQLIGGSPEDISAERPNYGYLQNKRYFDFQTGLN